MKRFFTVLFFLMLTGSTSLLAQTKYSRVKIDLRQTELKELASSGIDVTEGAVIKGVYYETDLSDYEINKLKNRGIPVEIQIDDVSAFYEQRAAAEKNLEIDRDAGDWTVPENWEYGSMGGFYTLEEAYAELDDMAAAYPDLISARQSISDDTLTHDGRKLFWVKISDNPNVDEDEPEVLYTAVHHAREPMSIQQMIFYMWYLLENYDTDEDIQRIVNNTELYFIPFINPDGYAYNEQTNPNGGGMWRKNRRDNGDGSFGVDPNRNYGYMWGIDNDGSSPYPDDQTYRGPSAFSEPEIKNVRDFCIAHDFQIALNYHSYSALLLTPWGYTTDLPPDNDLFMAYAAMMTLENNYIYGPASSTIYTVNGDSDDWMYGEQEVKDAIWAATPEVGNSSDGFWPPVSRIIRLCQDQMWQNMLAAMLVGNYGEVTDVSPMITDETDNYAVFDITRLGMYDTETFTVSIESLDDYIIETGEPVQFNGMELLETRTESIGFTLDAGIEEGTPFRYLISLDNGDFVISDTVTRIFGTEVVIFNDDGNTMDNWSSTLWGITNQDAHSPEYSLADSPYGNYNNDVDSYITLDTTISLADAVMATLRFWATWDIEKGYDYVQVKVKEEGSSNWISLHGNYSSYGNYYLEDEEPVYDGVQEEWVQEEISLQDFTDKDITLRFTFYSDGSVRGDGFYFDDLSVSVISTITGIDHPEAKNNISISDAYPNPAYNKIRISYNLSSEVGDNSRFELYNAIGNRVMSLPVNMKKGIIEADMSNLPQGIYYYRIKNGNQSSKTLKVIKL
jgi:hypothetical protein